MICVAFGEGGEHSNSVALVKRERTKTRHYLLQEHLKPESLNH